MKKVCILIAIFAILAWSQSQNWNGYGDTSRINNFYADTTVYSGWFIWSSFSNARHSCYLRDTSADGHVYDSASAEWGIQFGHPSWLTTNASKKKMELGMPVVIDTFNMTDTPTCFTANRITYDATGIPSRPNKFIDTLMDSSKITIRCPYAYQTRGPFSEWDVYFRYWAHGLAGNKNTKNLDLIFQASRQTGIKVMQ